MSTWTWQRWQQEIDLMALHGVNMPLQIVGLEVVWRNMLRDEYGYTKDEINQFVAGPCFMAWFGMNNLEGWGGENPDWWYERQEQLCKKINARMRELGIEPVLPGYSGMVPSNFSAKTGIASINQGKWCNFRRPYILDPNADEFGDVAQKYYKHLHKVMGKSKYYSMDPFHEGANTSGINVGAAYARIFEQMNRANKRSKWVIQQWQWSAEQYKVLDNVPVGRLIVLDLFSDGKPNFGGRTGIMGRFDKVITDFFAAKDSISTIRGIGAAPESIEQVPVLYDELYELPWLSVKPDGEAWMKSYVERRYSVQNKAATEAWQILRTTALNCPTALQGPHEAVTCARPSAHVDRVSTWGGTKLFYDAEVTVKAAKLLLNADLSGENYLYDLTDVTRQALTDYANTVLSDSITMREKPEYFLQIIYDIDRLLGTNRNFMLGKWTNMARKIADEVPGTTEKDRDWLELNNALMLITTWGERVNSEDSGLHDYSYRQWNGMLRDFYAERWRKYFAGETVDWFDFERVWTIDGSKKYTDITQGDTKEVAKELLNRYFGGN
jgi:alpha-N-acetylglucosaminidase